MNNLEYDHADIFPDLDAIKTQFQHLVRIVPDNGLILYHAEDKNLLNVLKDPVWSPSESFSSQQGDWIVQDANDDFSRFSIFHNDTVAGTVEWSLIGQHNAENACAAIAAANHIGVNPDVSIQALASFKNVKRRMQQLASVDGITVYDDFAHHPTAINATLTALRNKVGQATIHAILEPRSNTMKAGVHKQTLVPSMQAADRCYLFQSDDVKWDISNSLDTNDESRQVYTSTDAIIDAVVNNCNSGDHIIIMSNGGFENIHQRLIQRLQKQ